jgi:hypothetical protein
MIKVEQAPSARVRRSCFRCVLSTGNQILRGARGSIQLRPGLASRPVRKPANVGTRGPQRFALGLMLLRTAYVTDEPTLPLAVGRCASGPRIDRSMEVR